MNLLIDTHVALWAIVDAPRLSAQIRALIADPDNRITVSAVSIWEIAIKSARASRSSYSRPPADVRPDWALTA